MNLRFSSLAYRWCRIKHIPDARRGPVGPDVNISVEHLAFR